MQITLEQSYLTKIYNFVLFVHIEITVITLFKNFVSIVIYIQNSVESQ